jgi:uncharacterized protein with PQ loop repeat
MNFLYLTFVDIADPKQSGVFNKVKGQINAFESYFDIVYYTLLNNQKLELYRGSERILRYNSPNVLVDKILRMRAYYSQIIKTIEDNNINAIYIRFFMADPFFIWLLRGIKRRKVKIFVEIPTYPYSEEISKKIKKCVDKLSVLFLKKYVDKIVTFTDDSKIFGIETIKISNGIDLNSIPKTQRVKRNNINLVGVANVSVWHGYDRILKGLSIYYSNDNSKNDVNFHIVGEGNAISSLKKTTKELGLEKYVFFHGSKIGNELDEIFDYCHLGIGSLANHRKGLNRDSALKNREYCGRGIPFVIASDDDDFPNEFEYILRVEKNDNPISIEEVISYLSYLDNDDVSSEMRLFAEENLTWDVKLYPVIVELKNKGVKSNGSN